MNWMSRLQNCVALSSTKDVTIAKARKEMIRMTDYLEELGKKEFEKVLYINSQCHTIGKKIRTITQR